ncbi:MAG TPA: hypothetical protein VGJ26_08465 [Pirellulales bacterium]|jgi:hypothetical protein
MVISPDVKKDIALTISLLKPLAGTSPMLSFNVRDPLIGGK